MTLDDYRISKPIVGFASRPVDDQFLVDLHVKLLDDALERREDPQVLLRKQKSVVALQTSQQLRREGYHVRSDR